MVEILAFSWELNLGQVPDGDQGVVRACGARYQRSGREKYLFHH
ncbi:unnamed protein product [Periconia digitata]|uniref:Uncharacterized protein n=1 Tax=Periconia digitata TaxID=1303443 RepID=A0A9W4XSS5_9PLEO|nr:unnamed protein product [Periconia digitata]